MISSHSANDFSIKDIPVDATHFVSVKLSPSTNEDLQFLRKKIHIKRIFEFKDQHTVILEFHDIRHAHFAHTVLGSQAAKYVDSHFLSPNECSYATLLLSGIHPQMTDDDVRKLLEQFGSVWYLHRLDRSTLLPKLKCTFWIEYFDFRDATFAKSHLENIIYKERQLFCDFVSDFNSIDLVLSKFSDQLGASVPFGNFRNPCNNQQNEDFSLLNVRRSESLFSSSASVSAPAESSNLGNRLYRDPLYRAVKRPPGFEPALSEKIATVSSNDSYKSRIVDPSLPVHNQVHIDKIVSGEDKRTTFMIRNIPNKYTQQMLIDLVNESHRGSYDFLYLRMDFKNKCNVGYAFINFPNPKDAVSFAIRVCGKKWSKFNSEKICSMSYANIQGRESLVKKFRDSQVMFEDETYRPKLFYTSGERKGEEEDFPASMRQDNQDSRSIYNTNKSFQGFTNIKNNYDRTMKQMRNEEELGKVIEDATSQLSSSHLYTPVMETKDKVPSEPSQTSNEGAPISPEKVNWTPWKSSMIPFRPGK